MVPGLEAEDFFAACDAEPVPWRAALPSALSRPSREALRQPRNPRMAGGFARRVRSQPPDDAVHPAGRSRGAGCKAHKSAGSDVYKDIHEGSALSLQRRRRYLLSLLMTPFTPQAVPKVPDARRESRSRPTRIMTSARV